MNTLTKLLKNEKTPSLRNLVLLPLLVQQEVDPDIQVQIIIVTVLLKDKHPRQRAPNWLARNSLTRVGLPNML